MKVQCEKCKAQYQIDEGRIPPQGAQIRCPRCSNVFVVKKIEPKPQNTEELFELGSGHEAANPASNNHLPDLPEVPDLPPPPVFDSQPKKPPEPEPEPESEPEPETQPDQPTDWPSSTPSGLDDLAELPSSFSSHQVDLPDLPAPFPTEPEHLPELPPLGPGPISPPSQNNALELPALPNIETSTEPHSEAEGEFFTLDSQPRISPKENLETTVRYRIRRKNGKVFGPFDFSSVTKMLSERKIDGSEEASTDAKTYRPLRSFEEFAALCPSAPQEIQESTIEAEQPAKSPLLPGEEHPDALLDQELDLSISKFSLSAKLSSFLKRPGLKPWIIPGAAVFALMILGIILGFTDHGLFANRSIRRWLASPVQTSVQTTDGNPNQVNQNNDLYSLYRNDVFADYKTLIDTGEKQRRAETIGIDELGLLGMSYAALLRNHGANEHYLKQGRAILEQMKDSYPDRNPTRKVEAALAMLTDAGHATAILKTLLDADREDIESLHLAGWAATHQKNWPQALAYFQRAQQMQPSDPRAYYSTGDIHAMQGNFDAAVESYHQAVEKDPDNLRSLLALARIQIEIKNDFDQGNQTIEKLLSKKLERLASTERASVHFLKARWHLQNKDRDQAIAQLELAMGLAPSKVNYAAELGELYLHSGDYAKAHATYDKILKIDPSNLDAQIGKGNAIWKSGDIVQAKLLLEKVSLAAASDPRPLYLLGQIAEDLAKPKEALSYYKKASRIQKTYLEPQVAIAKLHMREGRIKKAVQQINQAKKTVPDAPGLHQVMGEILLVQNNTEAAKAQFEKALAIDPQMPAALFSLAQVYRDLGDLSKSLEIFIQLQQIAPHTPQLNLQYGYTLYKNQDYQKALEIYEKSLPKDPKNPDLYVKSALAADALKDTKKAIHYLQTATGLNQNNPDAYFHLGRIYERQGRPEEALELLRRAVELDPKNPETYYHMGLSYLGMEMSNDAIEAFKEATKRKPDYVAASLELGKILTSLYRHKEAIDYLNRAVRAQPKRLDLLLALGDAYQQKNNYKKALQIYQRAYKLDPKTPGLTYRLGRSHSELDQTKQAIRFYLMAIKNNPQDPMPHFYLGYSYKAQGNNRKAVAEFEQYLKLKPDAPDADEIQMEIDYLKK